MTPAPATVLEKANALASVASGRGYLEFLRSNILELLQPLERVPQGE